MQVRWKGKSVDVAKKICPTLDCFHLFQDKGTFVQGRGYTAYYDKPKWVCGTRHLHGCHEIGVCSDCRRVICAGSSMTKCESCGSTRIEKR